MYVRIETCRLKTRFVEPEETGVAKKWLYKYISTATKLRDRSSRYTLNNKEIVWRWCSILGSLHSLDWQFQTLLKKLFLTMHGHNIHCQQRELSKFLMR
jgi:hypothetical protein